VAYRGATTFAADVSRFAEKYKLRGKDVMLKVALDGYKGVIMRSPVDTGRFRGSWRVGINRSDLSVPEKAPPYSLGVKHGGVVDYGDEANSGELTHTHSLFSAKWQDEIHITNNLPYAGELEHGSSTQAPGGVLGLTVEALRHGIAEAVRSVS
jgi:hypothetical protein